MTRLVLAVLAAAIELAATTPALGQQPAGNVVQITLRPEVTAEASVVRLGQVAHLAGGNAGLREHIAALDLLEFKDETAVLVSRDQVRFRLLVGGVDERSFRIGDLSKTLVRRGPSPRSEAQPGAILPVKNEERDSPASPVLVKAHERVRLTAQIGPATAIVAGEAQQDGRLGQLIRVRNVDSNKIVQGRVQGPGQVEVEY